MPKCRKCSNEIAPEDFNVATDRAYCRRCNAHFTFSELQEDEALKAFDPAQVPRHVRVRQEYYGMCLRYRKVSLLLLFLIPFTALWSGGSMFGMAQSIKSNGFGMDTFFFLPFFLGTCVLLGVIVFLMFGRCELRDRQDELEIFQGVGSLGRRRRVAVAELKSVRIAESSVRSNNQPLQEIQLKLASGKIVKFGAFMTDESREFFAGYLNRRCRK